MFIIQFIFFIHTSYFEYNFSPIAFFYIFHLFLEDNTRFGIKLELWFSTRTTMYVFL